MDDSTPPPPDDRSPPPPPLPPSAGSPTEFLKNVVGKRVIVRLSSGVDYRGVLSCLDGYMNIAMEQTEEYVNGAVSNRYGDAFIRGNNDIYELANYHNSYSFLHWGTSNLELPVFALQESNSTLLLNVELSARGAQIEVPFHLRYGSPASSTLPRVESTYVNVKISQPVVLFSCPSHVNVLSSQEDVPEVVVQFLSHNSTRSVISFPVSSIPEDQTLQVPIGHMGDLAFVEYGTVLAIFLLFSYMIRASKTVATRLESRYQKKEE